MSLDITEPAVANAGEIARERVVFRANADIDLSELAVFCCGITKGGSPMGWSLPAAFWLSNRKINKGDSVIVYTKSGKTREKTEENGSKSIFYYWGRTRPIWTSDKIPVVAKLETWTYPRPLPSLEDEESSATE